MDCNRHWRPDIFRVCLYPIDYVPKFGAEIMRKLKKYALELACMLAGMAGAFAIFTLLIWIIWRI